MPSLVPGYEYDVFISYRQKDNRGDHWVTEFVNALRSELDATFKEDISVYFDENPHDGLLPTHDVDESLKEKLKCLIFIPIISQTYCDSNSFAWQKEFLAFKKQANEDQIGLKIKLQNGNVANRILPVRIHELDQNDKTTLESETGPLRSIDFIFTSAGVNRPLRAKDDEIKEIAHSFFYRDQVNKVANAVKEIVYRIKQLQTQGYESRSFDQPVAGHVEDPQPPRASNLKVRTRGSAKLYFMSTTILIIFLSAIYFGNKIWKTYQSDGLVVRIARLGTNIDNLSSIERGKTAWEAYKLVLQLHDRASSSELSRIWVPISRKLQVKLNVDEAGIFVKPYSSPTEDWILVGNSPMDSVRVTRGALRLKIEKEGFATQEDAIADRITYARSTDIHLDYNLQKTEDVPDGMVLASAQLLDDAKTDTFFVDRFETTNKVYKQFVDAGGYSLKKFWKYPIVQNDKHLTWEEAMALFVDKTGRPGPSTWVAGSFREGEENYPVSGVSWYEAAAFAEYAGKTLPTVHHFRELSIPWANAEILTTSNINGREVKPVGSAPAVTRFGTRDLAGNVREWVFNEVKGTTNRIIAGGSWNDAPYVYEQDSDLPAIDRSEYNGFRCIKIANSQPFSEKLIEPVSSFTFYLADRKKLTEDQFEVVKRQFDYDDRPLEAKLKYRKEEANWSIEKINLLPAYGKDSMSLFLFLPKNVPPPYQTVIYFPGSGAFNSFRNEEYIGYETKIFDHLVKTGRAVLFPIYYGTMERFDPGWHETSYSTPEKGMLVRKEILIKIGKDLRRSVDYIMTRSDLDKTKLGYFGFSQGGGEGAIMLTIESRIKAAVFTVCGISTRIKILPEIDRVNYLPRVHQPVLMLNSRYDWNFPYEISQKPFFDLLGTPKENKKLILYEESGHQLPWNAVFKESVNWFDQHLGKVSFAKF